MKRTASAVWQGTTKEGQGALSTASGALKQTPYTFQSRFAEGGATNPEELVAAAHAGCFAMALSLMLGNAGHPPDRLDVTATVSLDQVDGKWTITASHLELKAKVGGVDRDTFDQLARDAKANCPISRLLNAEITLDAHLET